MTRSDPIGARYYKPLRELERFSEALFYVSAALSIGTLLVDKTLYPGGYAAVQIAFVLSVLGNFVLGFVSRLYLAPRAEDKRRQDLLSNSYQVNLTHENALGYYNNDQTNPVKRLAASVMESSFFTNNILREMLRFERPKVILYFAIWIAALMIRSTDLGIIAAAAQVLFSEQILTKWLRLEWLRMRSERVYEKLHKLINTTTSFNKLAMHAHVMEHYSEYETGKAYASVTLSDRSFQKRNADLSREWEAIRAGLQL
ncbi:hypothetical protein X747_28755 [Mesorhizobium sp. LNJC384A00]|uniref:hypothetical protein n=1 Tax=Mesorhizobium sp. LNJC384A00 TaxID=1287268 RepID=UPI0003CF9A77|nr:hypothetical protein [Mesorhizobium sp. LNJC384A00]ESY35258.1 hypothetical protein X747_28755 [Mesorhizobium sp. LNJC384A00]